MDYPKLIVSKQKEESICVQRVKEIKWGLDISCEVSSSNLNEISNFIFPESLDKYSTL